MERTSVNITHKGHDFHPGDVTYQVHFEKDNLYFDLIGTGNGSVPSIKNWIGIQLFVPGVQDAVNRFGR
ncbi:hypothetical protein KDD30_05685 [Photobacterium sp. GJ3]|uniref:hypothetical protein n=1 Tax=Photobacterium sp. GJ3 TaxID=2829502 RepID=UPI001B8D7943|nr:hypothetical protein [Photobacterium sp. GJ3]QUJ68603.1 hypothetical protein KDD30_05685 [Photobacterium sp. GJ3]